MDSMSFLQKSLARRRSDGNIQMDDDEEEENGIGEDDVTQTEESDSVVMETEREGSTTPSGSCIVKSKKIQAESEDNLDRYCQWREARDERREKEREAERQQRQAWQDLQTDEVSTFLSSLAPCMRRLAPEKLSYLKIKMQELIHEVSFWRALLSKVFSGSKLLFSVN
ncbi:hypothetical protein UPYG_G00206310 [Umbra pygmaea]|uniref:BESS domain-containing protein n=1 Tax=Umbra pygmaea TaxID=75934 RepID=A0ABD0WPE2_UMBPY